MLSLGAANHNQRGDGKNRSKKRVATNDDREPPDEVRVKHFVCDVKLTRVGMTCAYSPSERQAERMTSTTTKYLNKMQEWFNSQRKQPTGDGTDALSIAYSAASAVQQRTQNIQDELNRVQRNKRQRKDMVDDNYHEPVLSPEFHNDLNISPSGLIYNSSRQIPPMAIDPSTRDLLPAQPFQQLPSPMQ